MSRAIVPWPLSDGEIDVDRRPPKVEGNLACAPSTTQRHPLALSDNTATTNEKVYICKPSRLGLCLSLGGYLPAIDQLNGDPGMLKGLRRITRALGFEVVRYPDTRPFWVAAEKRRKELDAKLVDLTNNTVVAGPYKGVKLSPSVSWGDYGSKVLGCYEEELHPQIEELISWEPDAVVNVGCAEGYHAVGLAVRLPRSRVIAYDVR